MNNFFFFILKNFSCFRIVILPRSHPLIFIGVQAAFKSLFAFSIGSVNTKVLGFFKATAFLLALIYRSWRLAAEDDLEVDEEDVAIGTRDTNVDEPDLEELATATDFDPVDEDEEQRQARSST